MAEISATVVTLNEEENIRDCLETLAWCDEIIIVDSHSDDQTTEIAREYTDQIFTYEQTGYGDPARKKALEKASGDWICMVDADERVPDSLATQLRQLVENDHYDVIYTPRKNYMFGEWINCAGWWPDYRPLLYKPSVAKLSTEIHNFLSFSENSVDYYLDAEEENSIIHFNYTDISDFISRMNRYTDIEAEQTEFHYWKLFLLPSIEFINRYFIQKGFRKGLIGLFLSIFMSWYRLLSISKAWQYKQIGNENKIIEKYERIH